MAIAFDSVFDGGRSSAASSKTFAFTNTAGDCVIVYARGPNGVSPTGVTYAGVAMTFVNAYDNGTDYRLHMYSLPAPATGANNVVITYAGSQAFIDAGAVSYSGTNQTTPTPTNDITNTASGATTFSPSMTTTLDNSWVIACVANSTGDSNASTNTAERFSNANGNGFYDSNALVSPAGSRTLNITRGSNSNWGSVLAQLAVPSATSAIKTVDGLAKASVKTVNGLATASVKTIDGLA